MDVQYPNKSEDLHRRGKTEALPKGHLDFNKAPEKGPKKFVEDQHAKAIEGVNTEDYLSLSSSKIDHFTSS
ncbi:MAG: hypothetical protein Q8T08_04520, partial [Ignavibacteria bacterium]|nr:hypothetical protein [Ignavibacteria bacterium]